MSFPTVIFGTGAVTSPGSITYTDGVSIIGTGYRLFILTKKNMGPNGADFGFTYRNQFGELKTTSITTAVAPYTTAGTRIQAVLEAGDVGVQDVVNATIIKGNAGDEFSFESWNEGSGRSPLEIDYTIPFDRTASGAHLEDPFANIFKGRIIEALKSVPILYYSNPAIKVPIEIKKSGFVAWIADVIVNRGIPARFIDPSFTKGIVVLRVLEPLSNRVFAGKVIDFLRTWLESVVGQVVSGYVTNTKGDVIKNATTVIIISSGRSEFNQAGNVNADTGLYQLFIKGVIYDKRYLMVKVSVTKTVALDSAGEPAQIDGTKPLPTPYDLMFNCPVSNCDFNVTRKK